MQVDFSVAATCLCFLLTSFTPVKSDIKITKKGNSNSIIIEENESFTLQCTATELEDKNISGSFKWERDNLTPVKQVPVEAKNVIINVTKAENKRSITSILTVKKTPPYFGVTFYYSCMFGIDVKPFAVFIIPVGAIPIIKIGNGTVRSIEAKYGEAVELICHVSYKLGEVVRDTSFLMRWRKENMRTILKSDKPSLTYSGKLENFPFKYTVVVNSYRDGGIYSCLLNGTIKSRFNVNLTSSVELKIKARNNGGDEKEIVEFVGKDVTLQCDIVGYPIQYEWEYEDHVKITGESNSRYSIKGATLAIKDITYDDRKKYICFGNYNNGTVILKQTIILRVKNHLAALWPFIGIVIEAIVIAGIIGGSEFYRSKRKTQTDGGNKMIDDEPASTTCT